MRRTALAMPAGMLPPAVPAAPAPVLSLHAGMPPAAVPFSTLPQRLPCNGVPCPHPYQNPGRVDDVINVSGHRIGTAEVGRGAAPAVHQAAPRAACWERNSYDVAASSGHPTGMAGCEGKGHNPPLHLPADFAGGERTGGSPPVRGGGGGAAGAPHQGHGGC